MLSALDAKIITIESRLSERDMDDLESILARVAATVVNGKYYDEWMGHWRTACWYSDDVLWALEKNSAMSLNREIANHIIHTKYHGEEAIKWIFHIPHRKRWKLLKPERNNYERL